MNTRLKSAEQLRAIRAAKHLRDNGLSPDAEGRKQLLLFNGWGTLKNIFSPKTGWEQEALTELKTLLTPEEYRYAEEAILNAFYTSPEVVEGMWEGLEHLGFNGGKILEPSCGTLRFKEYQSQRWQNHSYWYGVEQDHITGLIGKLLHPDAMVYDGYGFEEVVFPAEAFDLCIGNVPFGDYKVFDPDYSHLDLRIHNYFLYKSLVLTKVGGFCALITSTGTLDVPSNFDVRKLLAEIGDLVGAIRLPNTAFKQDAGTEVTSDILVFKRVPKREVLVNNSAFNWLHTTALNNIQVDRFFPELIFKEKQEKVKILQEFGLNFSAPFHLNYYYLHHPQYLLGVPYRDKLYGGDRFGLQGDDRNLKEAIALAFGSFNARYEPSPDSLTFLPIPAEFMREPIMSFCRWNERVFQRLEDEMVEVDAKNSDRIIQMLELYNRLSDVIEAQKGDNETRLMRTRNELNVAYDAFIKEFGYLNNPANQSILGSDISRYCLLMALELPAKECLYSFKALLKSKQHFTKADIFFQRTAKPNPEPLTADSAKDGLLISLNLRGYVDLELIADLTSKSVEEIIVELHEIDDPLIFFDPDQKRWVTKEQYLSGLDVRTKLKRAIEADLERNIVALMQIQPLYLLPPASEEIRAEIAARIGAEKCNTDVLSKFRADLGTTWIPDSVYESFIKTLIPRGKIDIKFVPPPVCSFSVVASDEAEQSAENLNVWGTTCKTGLSLFDTGLNLRDPVVYDEIKVKNDQGNTVTKLVKNPTETENARGKLDQIKEAFIRWLWSDIDRAVKLTTLYNEKINCCVVRNYDGSHLTIPNCNPEIKFRDYQKNGIWRCLQEQSTILGWVVGAGKTITFITAIMELKRLGLAHKPMLVVLDSTVPQIEAEFRKLYPTAKLLVLGPVTPSPQARRRFVTQMATCNWDAIICSHTQWFQGIQLSKQATLAYIQEELNRATDYIKDVKDQEDDEDENGNKWTNLRILKAAQKRLQNQIQSVINGGKQKKQKDGTCRFVEKRNKDRVINFEQTGVDCVVFDELHYAKNVYKVTKMGTIAGLPNPNAERGMDTFMKINWLLNNGGRFIGATGTPIANTLAEAWTNLRFTMLPQLEEKGIDFFDAFASLFLEMTSESEISSIGKYVVRRRCRNLINRIEFLNLYRQVVDIITADKLDLDGVPTQKIIPVNCSPSPQQEAYMDWLHERAEAVESGNVDPAVDNKVWITTHGRQGMLDIRLVSKEGKNCIYSKVNACVLNTYRIWEETTEQKGAQVIFINFSSPKNDERFDLYRYIRAALVALGIPNEQIAFIHECDRSTKKATNKEREKLYKKVNSGEVRVVLGSIKKLGTGVNIQQRLIAGHFVDCPFTPAEIEQGEGRILRWGNNYQKCLTFRYVTEGKRGTAGIDAWLWQLQEIKARQIWSALDYSNAAREIEDMTPTIISAATMKAISMGDPRLRRKAEVDNQVRILKSQRLGYEESAFRTKISIGSKKEIIANAERKIQLFERHLAQIDSYPEEQPILIEGEEIHDREATLEKIREKRRAFCDHLDALKAYRKKAEKAFKKGKVISNEAPGKFDGFVGTYLDFKLTLFSDENWDIDLFIGDHDWRYPLSDIIFNPEKVKYELTREGLKEDIILPLLKNQQIRIKTASADLKALQAITHEQFPHEEKLLELLEEQKQLDEELNPKEDAAVSALDDESDSGEENEEGETNWEKDATPAKFVGIEPEIKLALQMILKEHPLPDWWEELQKAIASYRKIDGEVAETAALTATFQSRFPSFFDMFEEDEEEEFEVEPSNFIEEELEVEEKVEEKKPSSVIFRRSFLADLLELEDEPSPIQPKPQNKPTFRSFLEDLDDE